MQNGKQLEDFGPIEFEELTMEELDLVVGGATDLPPIVVVPPL